MPVKSNRTPDMGEDTAENLKRFLEQTKEAPKYKQKTMLGEIDGDVENNELYEQNYPNLDEDFEVSEEDFKEPEPPRSRVTFNAVEREDIPAKERFKPKKANSNKPNPLSQYYREPGIFIKLPSQGNFNEEDDIEFSVTGEVEVYPLTAKDELWLKNPDALANGESIEKILKSCAPGIKSIRTLPTSDVSVLLLGMKFATYGQELTLTSKCPKCKTENHFSVDINELLSNMNFLKSEYVVELSNGIKVWCKPHTYDCTTQMAIITFEEAKLMQILDAQGVSDEEKKHAVSQAFAKIQDTGFYITAQSIIKVVTPDEKTVKDTDQIYDWLCNISIKSYNQIKDKITEINETGIPKSVTLTCANEKCKHEYPVDVTFDPSNFFV